MKLHFIEEPELEFARGTHACPRLGITQYDVFDATFGNRREAIHVGLVGTSAMVDRFSKWLERCRNPIPARSDAKQPNLFVGFCGFNRSFGFKSELVLNGEISRELFSTDVNRVRKIKAWNTRISEAVDLYYRQVKFLSQNRDVDVIVCLIPAELESKILKEESALAEVTAENDDAGDRLESNFRRALKAESMHLGVPLQLVLESSLETKEKGEGHDDATKAWNLCTALYYKAANRTVPWKLITNLHRPSACYVGIGFYRSRDKKSIQTSLAQVFNELGNGVILRGAEIRMRKEDRVPHLSRAQAEALLLDALDEYVLALEHAPGRLVVHKSSNFSDDELEGFRAAAATKSIRRVDYVTIMETKLRLFRSGFYPPHRGTRLEFDRMHHVLYTRGAVEQYKTYPGLYVPQPLEVRIVDSEESPAAICEEIIALTKMNWNKTQFDGKYPITIECARRVGQVMKYLAPEVKPQINYGFYM